jgi:hypothetical protein
LRTEYDQLNTQLTAAEAAKNELEQRLVTMGGETVKKVYRLYDTFRPIFTSSF